MNLNTKYTKIIKHKYAQNTHKKYTQIYAQNTKSYHIEIIKTKLIILNSVNLLEISIL